jgi:hypothetical protein
MRLARGAELCAKFSLSHMRGLLSNLGQEAASPTGRPQRAQSCCASSEDEGADAASQAKVTEPPWVVAREIL